MIFIKAKNTKTGLYLNPFSFEDNSERECIFKLNSVVEIYDILSAQELKTYDIYVFESEKWILLNNKKKDKIFTNDEFSIIKRDFNLSLNKDFIHYLIYLQIKEKDINKSFFAKKRGISKMLKKIFFVLKIIKNKEQNWDYILKPFPTIEKEKMVEILNRLKYNIENY